MISFFGNENISPGSVYLKVIDSMAAKPTRIVLLLRIGKVPATIILIVYR